MTKLSREDYLATIRATLTQQTPLNGEDIEALQGALKGVNLYGGEIDGDAGNGTLSGIATFLMSEDIKAENDERIIRKLGNPTLDMVQAYKKDPAFTRFFMQETMPQLYVINQTVIEDCLKDGSISPAENKDLLVALNALAYLPTHETSNNTLIAKALADYLKDNQSVELVDNIPIEYYPYLVKNGQAETLEEIIEFNGVLAQRQREIIEAIPYAAEANKVSPELMKAIWGVESLFGEKIVSGGNCEGDWHFSDDTWDLMMSRYGEKIAQLIKRDFPGEDSRKIAEEITANKDKPGELAKYQYHPAISAYGASFLLANDAKSMGYDPSKRENWKHVYSAYNIGGKSSIILHNMIKEGDTRPAVDVLGVVAKQNPLYFGEETTAEQALENMETSLTGFHHRYYELFRNTDRICAQERNLVLEEKSQRELEEQQHRDAERQFLVDDRKRSEQEETWKSRVTHVVSIPISTQEEKSRGIFRFRIDWEATKKQNEGNAIEENIGDTTPPAQQEADTTSKPEPIIISPDNNF